MILPLKNNFGRWIKIQVKFDHWNLNLTVGSHPDSIQGVGQKIVAGIHGGQHLGCRINTSVIWAVRSRWREEQIFRQKIGDLSPIFRRFSSAQAVFFIKSAVYRQMPINWRYMAIFCQFSMIFLLFDFYSQNIVSTSPDTRYIGYISSIYPDIFLIYPQKEH